MITYHVGDALAVLKTLPSESVHCVVTSPPYWGLRDYGTATWVGGDPTCDHHWQRGGLTQRNGLTPKQCTSACPQTYMFRDCCKKCGAQRIDHQIGLESTPDEFVARLVVVFREVRRVLHRTGTLWLVIGDSFAGGGGGGYSDKSTLAGFTNDKTKGRVMNAVPMAHKPPTGLKSKDLVGVPWMLAFALRADGWYLRSEIIWAKRNSMPESVTDRPTRSHETVFLLSKSKTYYYDADSIREPHAMAPQRRNGRQPDLTPRNGQPQQTFSTSSRAQPGVDGHLMGRNLRSVWHLTMDPFAGSHFAVFPREIPRRAILAGTSEKGVCPTCGAPWRRLTERVGGPPPGDHRLQEGFRDHSKTARHSSMVKNPGPTTGATLSRIYNEHGYAEVKTVGWEASCKCGGDPVPAKVLDCFGGAGTTALVANHLGRDSILIDLSEKYARMAKERVTSRWRLFPHLAKFEIRPHQEQPV